MFRAKSLEISLIAINNQIA